jgi:predicted ATP-dependent endonuclease of OLD family
MQRRLLYFLRKEADRQFFMTTHSNIFLDNALVVDRVFFTNYNGNITVDDATSRASILDDLGYEVTDNLVSDLIILVEGPTDVPILEEFLLKLDLTNKYNIKMWPLGGDIMDQLDLSVFAQQYSIIAVIDNDPGSAHVRNKFETKCKEYKIPIHRLEKYAIENYFTVEALKSVFKAQIPSSVTNIDSDKKLEEQIGISVKKNNRKIAQAMTIDEIRNTDFYKLLLKIEEKCKEDPKNSTSG